MKAPRFGVRLAVAGAILLAAFSFVATRAITSGHWPELPPGALRDLDLWTGLLFLAALVVWLLLSQRRRPT
jgi:hypothetical protein